MNAPLLWRFVLAHVVADFPLQPDALIQAKRKFAGVVFHAALFGIALAMVMGRYLEVTAVVFAVVGLTVFHGLVDWAKSLITKKLGRESIYYFLGDQALHLASLFVVAYLLRFRVIMPVPAYPPLAIGIVAVWAVPIIVELARSEFAGEELEPHSALGAKRGKLGMLERAGFFAAGLGFGWFLFCLLVAVPRIIGWLKGKKVRLIPVSWALAFGLGLAARFTI
ncbi:hypothetical protein DRQ36_03545 [bacterium]|nr:MAG: hypothetical protein DRQ36_03545 [bacterium]